MDDQTAECSAPQRVGADQAPWPLHGAAATGTIERAEIAINLDKKVIEKVTLEHKGGNRSEISLHSIELGKSLGDELFKFTAPPNTDRVDP